MSTRARKERKKAHRESGYSEETAFVKEPKRPTMFYLNKQERQKLKRQTKLLNVLAAATRKGKRPDPSQDN